MKFCRTGHLLKYGHKRIRRCGHLTFVHTNPGSVYFDDGREFPIAGDGVFNGPAQHIFPRTREMQIDLHLIPKPDLLSERAFFAQQDRSDAVLIQRLRRDSMFHEETHPDIRPQVIVPGMQHMKIGVKVCPANVYVFEVRQVWNN